ncbi:hypothetical protein POTOM_033204 [Populus tomentosa]|uniref:Uncharacterized protein n=1 Tax=Populus tomentosa TaxID=118781 RepID=A0A8X7Z5W2_POPTO|nr:hypothetical protein POTOM_033204 [Populus tomentosa]
MMFLWATGVVDKVGIPSLLRTLQEGKAHQPLPLCNRNIEDKAEREHVASIATQSCGIALALEAFCPEFHLGCKKGREGVTAGVPMVTWPLYAEQFDNEKLIAWNADIKKAIIQLMVDEEEIRNRARKLKEMERKETEEGGSSYSAH